MTNYLDLQLIALAGHTNPTSEPNADDVTRTQASRKALERFLMGYRGALDEMLTKIKILKDEFEVVHEYSPIEHVNSRMKSPESILAKVELRGVEHDFTAIRANIFDIAGVRITCAFISDIQVIADMLTRQRDDETHGKCPRSAVRASRGNARETVSKLGHGKWVVDEVSGRGHQQVREGLREGVEEGQGAGVGSGRGSHRVVP